MPIDIFLSNDRVNFSYKKHVSESVFIFCDKNYSTQSLINFPKLKKNYNIINQIFLKITIDKKKKRSLKKGREQR